jgi:hypothetical protein
MRMRFIVDVSVRDGVTDPLAVADALLDFLCGAGDVPWPEDDKGELIESVDGVDPVRE